MLRKAPLANNATTPITYTWEFGDGGTSTACSPIYTYQVEGVYAIKLTVTGLGGTSTLLITDYITVTEWVDKYPFKVAVPLVMR